MARVAPSKDGYTIRGILPPELRGEPDAVKIAFWSFVVAEGLKVKDRELAAGLDKDGKPLKPISPETRKYRKSAMTPTGRGDPQAPPLTPGYGLSRTRSLLSGRAFPDRAEFWWRFDPFTYDSWARILRMQVRQGRDVFGLSPRGLAQVTSRSWRAFARFLARKPDAPAVPPPAVQPSVAPAPKKLPLVGTTRMKWATVGIGATPELLPGQATGGATWPQWLKYLRSTAPPPPATDRRKPFNKLLRMMFGPGTRPGGPPGGPPPPAPPPAPMPPPKPAYRPDPAMFQLPTRHPTRPTPGEPIGEHLPSDADIEAGKYLDKPKKAKAPARPRPPAFPKDPAKLEVVRPLGGSTGAELVRDPGTGRQYVRKAGGNPGHLREEAAADDLYRAMGLDVPRSKVYTVAGRPVKLSEFTQGVTLGELRRTDPAAYERAREELRKGFVADALLGNWDVIGADADNILVTSAGKVLRIDNGGSLRYRAQGALKSPQQFANQVTELQSMRNPGINPAAAQVFGGIDEAQIKAQAKAIVRRKAAILKAAPAEIRDVLAQRIESLRDYARPPRVVKVGNWKPTPADTFRTFATTDEADRWAQEIDYRQWARDLTPAQRASIGSYKSSMYGAINRYHRDPKNRTATPEVLEASRHLDEALAAHPLPEPTTVIRHFNLSDVNLTFEQVAVGADIMDTGYVSTSVNPHHTWSGHRFEVRLPAGTPAGYVKVATSSHQGEYELLLGRSADRFRVVEIKGDSARTIVLELVVPKAKGKKTK
jgi:hypothetical protein